MDFFFFARARAPGSFYTESTLPFPNQRKRLINQSITFGVSVPRARGIVRGALEARCSRGALQR